MSQGLQKLIPANWGGLRSRTSAKKQEKCLIYDSVHTCPMSVWRDIHKSGNLTLLVYEGEANEEQILDAWDKLDVVLFWSLEFQNKE